MIRIMKWKVTWNYAYYPFNNQELMGLYLILGSVLCYFIQSHLQTLPQNLEINSNKTHQLKFSFFNSGKKYFYNE